MEERECDTRLKGQQRESSQSSQAFGNEVISEMALDRKKICFWVSGFNYVYLVLRREILVIAEHKAEYTADCQLFYPVAGISGGSQSGKGSPRRRSSVSQSSLPA